MTYAGLALIILGWIMQFLNKEKGLDNKFVILYMLGAGLLVVDGFLSDLNIIAVLNLFTVLIALGVLIKGRK